MRPRLFSIALVITLLYGGVASAFTISCLHAHRVDAASVSDAEMPDCCLQDDETGAAHCPMQSGAEPPAHDSAAVSRTGQKPPAHDMRQAIPAAHLSNGGSGSIKSLAETCQFCVSHSERAPAFAQSGDTSVSKRGDAIHVTHSTKYTGLSAHTFVRHAATTEGDPPGGTRRHVLHNVFLI